MFNNKIPAIKPEKKMISPIKESPIKESPFKESPIKDFTESSNAATPSNLHLQPNEYNVGNLKEKKELAR